MYKMQVLGKNGEFCKITKDFFIRYMGDNTAGKEQLKI